MYLQDRREADKAPRARTGERLRKFGNIFQYAFFFLCLHSSERCPDANVVFLEDGEDCKQSQYQEECRPFLGGER